MKCKPLLLALCLLMPSVSFAACFTVYDKSNEVVYQSQEAPIDMSGPISAAMQAKFPGDYLVFTQAFSCTMTVDHTLHQSPINNDSDK